METREQLETQLAELRAGRGAAILDGKKFDHTAIAVLESQLAAIDDVAQEVARRDRAAQAEAADKALAVKRAQLEALIGDDLQDTKLAQEAATVLAGAFSRKLERVTAMARLAADITHKPIPVCLNRL